MTKALVLKLPDFDAPFVVETDGSGIGIRVMLQQRGHPVACLSKTLAPKHHSLSAYEKELLAVIMELERWRSYLLDRHFQIKTDHFSLKYFLDQRITTPFQSKWLPRLLGFDYEILYRKGKDNQSVDALSKIAHGGELSTVLITFIFSGLVEEVQKSCEKDSHLQTLSKKVQERKADSTKFSWVADQLRRKGKLIVGNDDVIRQNLVNHFHSSAEGGHLRVLATNKRLANWFYQKGIKKTVKEVEDISMDFIDRLPMSSGKTVIMVVVGRLSKYAHFIPMSHPYSAIQVAQLFMDNVYKLHGLPTTIVSDKDKCRVEVVDETLVARDQSIQLFQFYLKRVQDRMKSMADKHTSEREFVEGDWVYLKLQIYRQVIVRQSAQHKLSPKSYGPFQLKKCKTSEATMGSFPHCRDDGLIVVSPIAVLDRRMIKKKNRVAV
ncbi:retrotransposon-related protein [Tanacetum coccineum]